MPIPEVMQGVQLVGHGGPEKLVWNPAIPVPVPGPGEALVRVLAAGVNNTDINTRLGWYAREVTGATDSVGGEAGIEAGGWAGALRFPLIQGGDLCGEVVALAPGTPGPAPGRRSRSRGSGRSPLGARIGAAYPAIPEKKTGSLACRACN